MPGEAPALVMHGDVDALTGDVRHPGDLRVLGTVRRGREVQAGGRVFVSGDVLGAVSGEKDVIVGGGVLGRSARVDAVGSIVVREARDATLTAGFDVEIRWLASRARVVAGRRVVLTEPGVVQGGEIRAGAGLEARELRAANGRPVLVHLGPGPFGDEVEPLEERLGFVRERAMERMLGNPEEPEEYRRRLAEGRSLRNLAERLERRLRQVRGRDAPPIPPYLRIAGRRPVEAEVRIGDSEDLLPRREAAEGSFVLVLEEGGVRMRRLEDAIHVGG